jgi:predicted RNA-binding protein with PIN domain
MTDRWVLVDGYSVLHAWPQLRRRRGASFEQRRDALLRILEQYADGAGCRVTVVFDGYAAKRKPETAAAPAGIEVLFSDAGKTADDTIERLVGQTAERSRILVVSSDTMERQTVESMGAHSTSAEMFQVEVEQVLKELGGLVRQHGRPRRIGSVRDRFSR